MTIPKINAIIEQALAAAQAAQKGWARMTGTERGRILRRAADIIRERNYDLSVLETNDTGKPLQETLVADATSAADALEYFGGLAATLTGEHIQLGDDFVYTIREPLGVCVGIGAWNYPTQIAAWKGAPALACGNAMVFKPSETTPLCALKIAEILHEAGLPQDWARAVNPSRDDATKMVTDSRVAFFTFIGSSKVGWSLRSQLAPGTRCALEHGGVAPVIVDQTANLDDAVPSLAKGGFYHSGQVCVSVQRVYAHSSIAEDLANRLAEKAKGLKVGNAIEEDVECGPLIRPSEVDRVAEWVDEAREGGATVLCGGEKLGDTTYAPTVLLNPSDDATISKNEVFGPVVCVYSYDDVDDAIARANSLDVSFQAAVFTNDLKAAMHTYRNINASAVMVNDHTAFRVDWMPFAGLKTSGHGTGGIPYTMHEMTIEKMIVINS